MYIHNKPSDFSKIINIKFLFLLLSLFLTPLNASTKSSTKPSISNSKIHSKLINFLDRIFIDVLKSNPSKAPQIFQSFGKSFNGDDMAFFMSSKIRIIPILKMIFNLPTKIFIKSFIRCLFND